MPERENDTSPGIPAELEPGDRGLTGEVYTRSTEAPSVGGPGFGDVIAPPGEGGVMTRPESETEDGTEDEDAQR